MISIASKTEITVQPVFGLCFHSSAIKNVDYEVLWLVLLNEGRPGARAKLFDA